MYHKDLSWDSFYLILFIGDFFYGIMHSHACNFLDKNTVYDFGQSQDSVVSDTLKDMKFTIDWFSDIEMVANSEKSQLMFVGLKDE